MNYENIPSPNATQKNFKMAENIIRQRENPNPLIIVIIVIVVIIFANIIFKLMLKSDISGRWVSQNNESHIIYNNTYTGNIIIDGEYFGKITDNVIEIYTKNDIITGILYKDTIKWHNNNIWIKEVNLYI